MRIERVLVVPAWGGYYNDDLEAIRSGATHDGLFYTGAPVTQGFERIRVPAEAASIVLVLDNGQAVAGDAMSVAYSGAGGRQTRFRHDVQLPLLRAFCERLVGRTIEPFLAMCDRLDAEPPPDARLNRTAALYGLSQALLRAVSIARGVTEAEVLAEELGETLAAQPIAVNVQCGDERRIGVDKAIARRAEAMPHGLINSLDVLGTQGELLLDYASWIMQRIKRFADSDYRPEIHIDTYGMLGRIFGDDAGQVAAYIATLAERLAPLPLCLETPVIATTRAGQIESFGAIRRELRRLGSDARIIVDEWANDLDDIRAFVAAEATDMINVKSPDLGTLANAARAIRLCWTGGVRPILGGSCTDTDLSARAICQVALAVKPAWVLARPGMGIDEGVQIMRNEMARTLAIAGARR